MSRVFITSDQHFGHPRMQSDFRSQWGFRSVQDMNEYMVAAWNRVVTKRDVVWVLGDIAWTKSALVYYMPKLNGIKKLVLGNHDTISNANYLKYFTKLYGMVKVRNVWLSHAPLHPKSLRGRLNFHGHIHTAGDDNFNEQFYYNVNCEYHGFTPVPLVELIEEQNRVAATWGLKNNAVQVVASRLKEQENEILRGDAKYKSPIDYERIVCL